MPGSHRIKISDGQTPDLADPRQALPSDSINLPANSLWSPGNHRHRYLDAINPGLCWPASTTNTPIAAGALTPFTNVCGQYRLAKRFREPADIAHARLEDLRHDAGHQ
ncbi:MAG: hypothetical protein NVS4B6_20200 [Mycobacterium sp.]